MILAPGDSSATLQWPSFQPFSVDGSSFSTAPYKAIGKLPLFREKIMVTHCSPTRVSFLSRKGVYFRSSEAHRVLQRREQQVSSHQLETGK